MGQHDHMAAAADEVAKIARSIADAAEAGDAPSTLGRLLDNLRSACEELDGVLEPPAARSAGSSGGMQSYEAWLASNGLQDISKMAGPGQFDESKHGRDGGGKFASGGRGGGGGMGGGAAPGKLTPQQIAAIKARQAAGGGSQRAAYSMEHVRAGEAAQAGQAHPDHISAMKAHHDAMEAKMSAAGERYSSAAKAKDRAGMMQAQADEEHADREKTRMRNALGRHGHRVGTSDDDYKGEGRAAKFQEVIARNNAKQAKADRPTKPSKSDVVHPDHLRAAGLKKQPKTALESWHAIHGLQEHESVGLGDYTEAKRKLAEHVGRVTGEHPDKVLARAAKFTERRRKPRNENERRQHEDAQAEHSGWYRDLTRAEKQPARGHSSLDEYRHESVLNNLHGTPRRR